MQHLRAIFQKIPSCISSSTVFGSELGIIIMCPHGFAVRDLSYTGVSNWQNPKLATLGKSEYLRSKLVAFTIQCSLKIAEV